MIVVLSASGRSPNINLYYGRDRWSVALAGCRLPRGAVHGKTNANRTAVDEAGQ